MRNRYGVSLGNILLPTDFSRGSDVAFGHALKLALGMQGKLEILHVDPHQTRPDWDNYPSVRETLCRWNVLPAGARKADVVRLGVGISKSACKGPPAGAVLEHLERRGADLVVMATHRREGLDRWLHTNIAESISNRTDAATLFVPYGIDGFINYDTGAVSLRRVLIPIDSVPDPQPAIDAIDQLVQAVASESEHVEVRLLHIGDPAGTPSPTLPNNDSCRWSWETRVGNVVDAICEDAVENDVDLIAMTTNGHDGFLDAVRGSTTERVLHRAECPVLSVHESCD